MLQNLNTTKEKFKYYHAILKYYNTQFKYWDTKWKCYDKSYDTKSIIYKTTVMQILNNRIQNSNIIIQKFK